MNLLHVLFLEPPIYIPVQWRSEWALSKVTFEAAIGQEVVFFKWGGETTSGRWPEDEFAQQANIQRLPSSFRKIKLQIARVDETKIWLSQARHHIMFWFEFRPKQRDDDVKLLNSSFYVWPMPTKWHGPASSKQVSCPRCLNFKTCFFVCSVPILGRLTAYISLSLHLGNLEWLQAFEYVICSALAKLWNDYMICVLDAFVFSGMVHRHEFWWQDLQKEDLLGAHIAREWKK